MNYFKLETELCNLLQHHGWIERIERNRQDRFIDWTPLGRERGTRFVDEVRVLWPKREWTDEELAYLRSFGIYEGFIKATRRDRTIAAMKPFIECRNLIVVSTAASKHRHYRLFTARSFDDFFDYVEGEQDSDREVMLLSINDILASNVGRAFPFGIPGSEGKTVWQRGE